MIGLPRSTYYRRRLATSGATAGEGTGLSPTTAPGSVTAHDVALGDSITAMRRVHPAYGYRRVTQALRRDGPLVNKKRVQR
jgi:hypothetical protein